MRRHVLTGTDGIEQVVVRTIDVPPSTIQGDQDGLWTQAEPMPDLPEAGIATDEVVSRLDAFGDLEQQVAKTVFPLEIHVTTGQTPGGFTRKKGKPVPYRLRGNRYKKSSGGGKVPLYFRAAQTDSNLRFSVKTLGGGSLVEAGILPDFKHHGFPQETSGPTIAPWESHAPTGYQFLPYCPPAVIEDNDGILRMFALVKETSSGDYYILTRGFHQRDGYRSAFGTDQLSEKLDPVSDLPTFSHALVSPQIAATRDHLGNIVIFVADKGIANTRNGEIWSFYYASDRTPVICPMAGPITRFSDTTPGTVVIDGGIAAGRTNDQVYVMVGTLRNGTTREVAYAASQDGVSWSSGDGTESFINLAGTEPVVDFATEDVLSIDNFGATTLYAVSSQFFYTTTDLANWTKRALPYRGKLSNPVIGVVKQGQVGQTHIYIGGEQNGIPVLIRSTDAGETWKIMSGKGLSDVAEDFEHPPSGPIDLALIGTQESSLDDRTRGTDFRNATTGRLTREIVCDEFGRIAIVYGSRVVLIKDTNASEVNKEMIVTAQVNRPDSFIYGARFMNVSNIPGYAGLANEKDKRVLVVYGRFASEENTKGISHVLITNPVEIEYSTKKVDTTRYAFSMNGEDSDWGSVRGIIPINRSTLYGISEGGTIIRFKNVRLGAFSGDATEEHMKLEDDGVIEVVAAAHTDAAEAATSNAIHGGVVTQGGQIYRVDITSRKFTIDETRGTEPAGVVATGTTFYINGLAGTSGFGLSRRAQAGDQRCYPSVLQLDDATIVCGITNITNGLIELWRVDGSVDSNFQRIPSARQITFSSGLTIDFSDPVSYGIPRATLFRTDDGYVHIMGNHQAYIATNDELTTWAKSTSNANPLPYLPTFLQSSGTDVTNSFTDSSLDLKQVNRTIIAIPYGGGRVFLFLVNAPATPNIVGIWTSRAWDIYHTNDDNPVYPPVLTGTPQNVGYSDTKVLFSGSPRFGSTWQINPTWRYSIKNLAIPTPSIQWRSTELSGTATAPINLIWDRMSDETIAILGDTDRAFIVNGCALFGLNFPFANFDVAIPTWVPSADEKCPIDPSLYFSFRMSSVVSEGRTLYSVDHTSTTDPATHCIIDRSQVWIPDQFSAGIRSYYVCVENDSGARATRKIVANSKDTLFFEGDPLPWHNSSTEYKYIVFSDRMFCDGEKGKWGDIDPAPGLVDSQYEHTRAVRVVIDTQWPTAESHYQIGTPWIGRVTRPSREIAAEGQLEASSFSPGAISYPNINIIEERTRSGVESVSLYGNWASRYKIAYDKVRLWEYEQLFNMLTSRLHLPIAIVFDSKSAIETLTLARITGLPNVKSEITDYVTYEIEVTEIV